MCLNYYEALETSVMADASWPVRSSWVACVATRRAWSPKRFNHPPTTSSWRPGWLGNYTLRASPACSYCQNRRPVSGDQTSTHPAPDRPRGHPHEPRGLYWVTRGSTRGRERPVRDRQRVRRCGRYHTVCHLWRRYG